MSDIVTLQIVASALAGSVVTGIGMVVRGDFLGRSAANEVERRLNARMDREFKVIQHQLDRIERYLSGD